MHICLVSREYPPNPMGGIGTYVANMARVLADAGHRVSVLTKAHPAAPTCGYDSPHVTCGGRLSVRYLPFIDGDWRIDPAVRTPAIDALAARDNAAAFGPIVCDALGRLLAADKIDAIEAPEYEAPLLYFQQKRAALPPGHPWHAVPTVVHLHSPSHMIFQHDDDWLESPWVQACKAHEALSIRLADGVLSPSAFLAGQVGQWLNLSSSVRVIPYPNGPLLDVPHGIVAEPKLCLFVGRVEPRKGVFEFVEAAIAVLERHPDARFRFVGGPHRRDGRMDGPETADILREAIPEKFRSRFQFAGRVPRETLGAEYARASFVAVPSRWDNFPNTCMEAMACARPVLATDQGGMREMMADGCGTIVPFDCSREDRVKCLTDALDSMLSASAEELRASGQRARQRILSYCDDARVTALHEEYYTSLRDGETDAAATVRDAGILLFSDGAGSPADALRAANAQTKDIRTRVVVGEKIWRDSANMGLLEGWSVLPSDGECRLAGREGVADTLARLCDSLPDVLYIGAADDVLHPDSLRMAANTFANLPGCDLCACWTKKGNRVCAAFRNDPAQIARPATFPERWFFRTSAIRRAGGPIGAGYHLQDVLRDLAVRILRKGGYASCIPQALVEVAEREDGRVVRPVAFSERRDSVREVLRAHADLFLSSPDGVLESLGSPCD